MRTFVELHDNIVWSIFTVDSIEPVYSPLSDITAVEIFENDTPPEPGWTWDREDGFSPPVTTPDPTLAVEEE